MISQNKSICHFLSLFEIILQEEQMVVSAEQENFIDYLFYIHAVKFLAMMNSTSEEEKQKVESFFSRPVNCSYCDDQDKTNELW